MPPFFKALFNWFRADAPEPPGAPASDREATPALSETSPPPRRSRFGRFVVESELGRGAMGAVYKGVDPQTGEAVAIKTIALVGDANSDEAAEVRARFHREADTARMMAHPDIVGIRDAGSEGDIAYIAMEFVEGRDLSWYCAPSRLLPEQDSIAIVARIADALAYAHSQGVIHRDIKPANVMVDPAHGVVKITDFGVARLLDSSRTRSGVVLGTPAYMSPEQMAGGQIDGRSDLYSLGVLLFNLLTGQLPHRATSMAQLMFQIANHAPQDVRTLRPELSPALADVVTLALEKRPEVRYADGRQFAADLREVAAMLQAEHFASSVTTHNDGVAP